MQRKINVTADGNTMLHSAAVPGHGLSVMKIAQMGVLAAMATVLMYLDFPLPLMPAWLKFDFSEVPILLAAFSLGPIPAMVIELVKNLIHMPVSSTFFSGELANFMIGSSLVVTAGIIYQRGMRKSALEAKDEKLLLIKSMALGTLAMTLAACVLNYFVNIPILLKVMGLTIEDIVGSCKATGNLLVHDKLSLIAWVFVPFNIFKGSVVALLTGMAYGGVKDVLLHKKTLKSSKK